MKKNLIGIDIGGTKCAVLYGQEESSELHIASDIRFPTSTVDATIEKILSIISEVMKRSTLNNEVISAVGVSCGGPLDSRKGLIQSPPNLPGWNNVPIVEKVRTEFGIKTGLQNDANACALAEWKYGAGRGTENMIFLTFGTGLGAGLILGGKLFSGTNDNAGELGHIRLSEFGPVGYGKSGAFEGFCSGGGIAQIAQLLLKEKAQMGITFDWCPPEEINRITAKKVADEAFNGNPLAKEIFRVSGLKLGQGLSIIMDVLNPEMIVIGGIYTRCKSLLEPFMMEVIEKEVLPDAQKVCRILSSQLGEQIGSYSALSVAADLLTE